MANEILARVRIVLVQTSHPGNIGAVARAMKTMSLSRLSLVRPGHFPCAEATARAAGADDLLYRAQVCDSLEEALRDCHWVLGTSARARRLDWPEFTPELAGPRLVAEAAAGDVAVVFGREHSGLSNAEVDQCRALLRIPANPEYSSLNLAAAVQLVAYETAKAAAPDGAAAPESAGPRPSSEEMEGLYGHFEQALTDIGYYDPEHPKHLMRRLRRLFNRAEIDQSELNILRGILAAAQRAAGRRGQGPGG